MIKIRKSLPEFSYEVDGCNFRLRPFSEVELEEFNFMMREVYASKQMIFPTEAISYSLNKCLVNWSGVCGEDGKELPYKKGDEKYLPAPIRSILTAQIFQNSVVSEEEKKR